MHYDLVVIGSGPAGQKGAIAAAKLNKRVAVIERRNQVGGVCLHTGTIPSKTMREAILTLTGFKSRHVHGDRYREKRRITMQDLNRQIEQVVEHEVDVIRDQLDRNGIDCYTGEARFVAAHDLLITNPSGGTTLLSADRILIASGTRPARPASIPFDGERVFDSDEILKLNTIPRTMIVVGGGVIGLEYALMFGALGVRVTVVDGRERLLDFCDREIIDSLLFHARLTGLTLRLGEDVVRIDHLRENRIGVQLESGKRLIADTVLYTTGRDGDTEFLNLEAAGLKTDGRGRLWCDENHKTWAPHVYGVGDVVGFPGLASVAMEQGRRAVCHMYDQPFHGSKHLPYGLYTIPEISMVGQNEQQLTKERVPYEVGVARFKEIARGQIVGDQLGLLKLLFHRGNHKLLGVHCIGESATEIIHIGQAVMSFEGTIDYFRDTVFNYPTMAECYKVAAFDGLNKLYLDQREPAEPPAVVETAAVSPLASIVLQ